MKPEEVLPIELTPECEARLDKFANERHLSREGGKTRSFFCVVFLLTAGVKHLMDAEGTACPTGESGTSEENLERAPGSRFPEAGGEE